MAYIINAAATLAFTSGSTTVAVTGTNPILEGVLAGDLAVHPSGALPIAAFGATTLTLVLPAPSTATVAFNVMWGPSRSLVAQATQITRAVWAQIQAWGDRGLSIPVIARQNAPPSTPADLDRYLVGATGSGAWAGKSNQIATWSDTEGGWICVPPAAGWQATINGQHVRLLFSGTSWATSQVTAADVDFTPAAGVAADNVQAAIEEVVSGTATLLAGKADAAATATALAGKADAAATATALAGKADAAATATALAGKSNNGHGHAIADVTGLATSLNARWRTVLFLEKTTNQSLTSGTSAAVTWTGEIFDDLGMWSSGAPTRIVIPSGVGRIRISYGIVFATNSTGVRQVYLERVSAGYPLGYISHTQVPVGSGSSTSWNGVSGPIAVTAGEQYELWAFQNSGGALNVSGLTSTWLAVDVIA